jgi:hypothetical protein
MCTFGIKAGTFRNLELCANVYDLGTVFYNFTKVVHVD